MPIVRSLLETDLYKFSMWQALLHSHPGAVAEYRFHCRSVAAFPLSELVPQLEEELDALCELRFSPQELTYLRGLRYLKADFLDFLSVFRFQRRFIEVEADGPHLRVVAHGPIVHAMGFEIFVLYIVSELYFRRAGADSEILPEARSRLREKIRFLHSLEDSGEISSEHPFFLSDFGLRRRHSATWHDEVVETLLRELPRNFTGTSNVHQARVYGTIPVGTMAHEYLQAYQSLGFRLRDFQKAALEGWVQEFRGDLGIALTDVVGMDAFLSDFDLYFAKLFDGLRHDSGDPIAWGEKALAHYRKLRIDARTKRFVFSDGLDFPTAVELHRHFRGRVQIAFGIGTNLTNDTPVPALNMVMKMVSCNGQPVAKLSDSPGKTMCDDETYLAYLRQVFGIHGG